ncbi:hypothetical protein CRE_13618 [Caenorhabditis remanei]|uniref:Uncharacterized protein n=1 Tax=Caenorhabditis remanei TaxID=31234 RepID=E3N1A8_CAERE|nr:hypothetical protein CRE_13618 [Caenorhabditis remanei]
MRLVVTSVYLLSVIITYFTTGVESKKCRDGVHNVITIDSYGNETLPVEVRKIRIHVYDHDMKPSCYKRKVNVVMPGWFKIKSGEVDTSRDYDIVKDGAVSVSVSLDGDHICLNGHSDMFIVPESLWWVINTGRRMSGTRHRHQDLPVCVPLCPNASLGLFIRMSPQSSSQPNFSPIFSSFEMSTFVPKDICETLQQKGLHTLEEIEKKTGFNSTLEIPASPSFLGISLLDVLKGNYRIKISIASEGKKIVEFALPTGYTDLKMGLNEADEED